MNRIGVTVLSTSAHSIDVLENGKSCNCIDCMAVVMESHLHTRLDLDRRVAQMGYFTCGNDKHPCRAVDGFRAEMRPAMTSKVESLRGDSGLTIHRSVYAGVDPEPLFTQAIRRSPRRRSRNAA
jgi:S-adenosylmethionine/arginine decarboxylase-like enzyme